MSLVILATMLLLWGTSCDQSLQPLIDTEPDTTSHNFVWKIDTLGDGNSSALYDVIIINDTLIFATGEIYLKDSTGRFDPLPNNLASWNGSQWRVKKVTVNYKGNQVTPPLEGIFAFSLSDLWLSSGVPVHGDNVSWTQYHLFDMGVLTQNDGSLSKLWGRNSNDLYFVGRKGTLVHYDGGSWQKIASGTSTNISDIYGLRSVKNGRYEAYCAVTDFFQPKDKKVLKISEGGKVDSIAWTTGRDVVSIWSADGSFLYACGDGLFENSSGEWKEIKYGANIYTNHVRGSASNNVVVVGDFGLIVHFNGITWKTFFPDPSASYNSVAVSTNMVVVVGRSNGKAVAVIGRKTQ